MNIQNLPQSPILGLLDIGTSKIACVLLSRVADGTSPSGHRHAVVGFGHQRSRGLKAGVVIDAEVAEDAVHATIAQAESMAGVVLQDVVISASCGRIMSSHMTAGLDLAADNPAGRNVVSADMERLYDATRAQSELNDRAVLNLNTIAARIDDQSLADDAIGACGRRLSVDIHAVAADRAPLRHLLHVVERCQLRVLSVAPSPVAAALAVTTPDQRQRGVSVVDLGAGTTGVAVYVAGRLACAHVFPVGGNHLTFDLMRALDVSITEAERIKKNYAIQQLAHPAPDEKVIFQPRGDDHATAAPNHQRRVTTKQVTRAQISTILTSRLDAIVRQVLHRLNQLAVPSHLCGDLVLTGGGCQLSGIAAFAAPILGRPVLTAAPLAHTGLPFPLLHPAFATVAGLETFARSPNLGLRFDLHPTEAPARTAANAGFRRSF